MAAASGVVTVMQVTDGRFAAKGPVLRAVVGVSSRKSKIGRQFQVNGYG